MWKGDHFDAGEHAVFDVDRSDVAAVVGVDEERAAAVPEVLAVFFARFDVQFLSLSSHFLIQTLSVSMYMTKAGTKGLSARKLPREEALAQGNLLVEAGLAPRPARLPAYVQQSETRF